MNSSLEDLADQNIVRATRVHATWQQTSRLHEADGLLMHQGTLPLPLPFQNCVLRLDTKVPPAKVIEQADVFFGQGSANPYAVITRSRRDDDLDWHLRESGFHLQGDAPAMLTEAPIAGPTLDNRWRLRAVTQTCELEGFVQVCADAYASLGLPPTFTPSYFTRPEGLLAPDVSMIMAYDAESDRPMSAAIALHHADTAGIYWVGTRPEARGAHLAKACTAAATNLALARGSRAVTLQATPMGEGAYRQLGYREYARQKRWSR